jgi:hypothetical protein
MSEDTKADLEAVLELATLANQGGAVAVKSYQKTSTSGKTFTVSAAQRGAPGPKNGITNPGGGIRSGLSTNRLANESGKEEAEAMGSRNTVTVGSSGIGRSPLNPYSASGVATPPHTAGALAAAANAASAGAALQATAVANQAASAAAQAAKTSSAYNWTSYPKSTKTPYTFTNYPKSSGSSSSGSSGGSKMASALSIAAIGLRAASLGHAGLAGGRSGRGMGSLLQRAHDTASRSASRTASEDARRTASEHAHETASRDAREHARETASRDAEKASRTAGKEVTSLSIPEIIDLQITLSRKGYPVKVNGRLDNEFITIATAYLKASK